MVEDTPEAEPVVLPVTPKAAPQREETKKDIYGLGEEWWREKVRPWQKQFEEASEDYETKNKELLEESKTLIIRKFGSYQQFKSAIVGIDRVKEERDRYEARLIEAQEMLKKISREAEESGADPDWVTGASEPRQTASLTMTDAYGRDEPWWREKMFIQRLQLKEAVENYEKAYEKYIRDVEELGPSRFGRLSLTQYQMFSGRLDALNNEMEKYQAQIAEASESLKGLLRDAEESKANPDWVK